MFQAVLRVVNSLAENFQLFNHGFEVGTDPASFLCNVFKEFVMDFFRECFQEMFLRSLLP
jgi:hypothetical protein